MSVGSPRVTVRLPEPQLERLHETAAAQGATLSDVIRGRLQAPDPEQATASGDVPQAVGEAG